MSSIKILPRILATLSDAKKLYTLQTNMLTNITSDLNNVGEMLVKATDDIPVVIPQAVSTFKLNIYNTLQKIDKHVSAAKLMSKNIYNNRNIFDIALNANTSPLDPTYVDTIKFQNTVFNTSMSDDFNIYRYYVGVANLGKETIMQYPYNLDITVDGTDPTKGYAVLNDATHTTFEKTFIPGDTLRIIQNNASVITEYFYQIMFINEADTEMTLHAMPGQTITSMSSSGATYTIDYHVNVVQDGGNPTLGVIYYVSGGLGDFGADFAVGDTITIGTDEYKVLSIPIANDLINVEVSGTTPSVTTVNDVIISSQPIPNEIVSISSIYNFLNPLTTYWYDPNVSTNVETDVVCSRTFRSLNNRVLISKSIIDELQRIINNKIKELDSYCDFIKSLYESNFSKK